MIYKFKLLIIETGLFFIKSIYKYYLSLSQSLFFSLSTEGKRKYNEKNRYLVQYHAVSVCPSQSSLSQCDAYSL